MPYENLGTTQNWLTLVLMLVFLCGADVFLFKVLNKIYYRSFLVGTQIALVCSWLFAGECMLTYFFLVFSFAGIILLFFLSPNVAYLASTVVKNRKNYFVYKNKKQKSREGEVLFDRDAVYGQVADAVLTMSKHKCGALITFEKRMPLDDIVSKGNGTILNSPICAELLETIFYEGTRLHDGAVVVRNDTILAASVFFEPSKRPLAGKYGSRHRAAIGISEISDAVTVVVSEETGRISLAYDGDLHPVINPDDFLTEFEDAMSLVINPELGE